MNDKIISCLGSCIFLLCLPFSVQAETVLAQIQRTGILKIAIREDAPPFGYLDPGNNLQGYCLDFFTLLEKRLIKNLERNTLSIKLFKSTTNNRFDLVDNGLVDLECGPNTISTDTPENTSFSTAFFTTGTQFLIKESDRDRIKLDRDLNQIKLGVIRNTTTEKFITEAYPLATIQRFSGVTARARGIQAVEQGTIDAMVSDGILLRAEARQQELSASKYPLIPKTPLTCDRYGMIITKDPQWQDFVNSVISSSEAEKLLSSWFKTIFDYERVTLNSCETTYKKTSF